VRYHMFAVRRFFSLSGLPAAIYMPCRDIDAKTQRRT
jgi:hypothetical protein